MFTHSLSEREVVCEKSDGAVFLFYVKHTEAQGHCQIKILVSFSSYKRHNWVKTSAIRDMQPKTKKSVKTRAAFPATLPFTELLRPRCTLRRYPPHAQTACACETAWSGRGCWSAPFTTGGSGARPRRGWWRGSDTTAAFCWETARPCRGPTACVWGELWVLPHLIPLMLSVPLWHTNTFHL